MSRYFTMSGRQEPSPRPQRGSSQILPIHTRQRKGPGDKPRVLFVVGLTGFEPATPKPPVDRKLLRNRAMSLVLDSFYEGKCRRCSELAADVQITNSQLTHSPPQRNGLTRDIVTTPLGGRGGSRAALWRSLLRRTIN